MAGHGRATGALRRQVAGSFITRVVRRPAEAFIHMEQVSAAVLFLAALAALVWANSPWDGAYQSLWHSVITVDVGIFRISEDAGHWVNDGLMAIFFFVVGLEIKREVLHGELSDRRKAALPLLAAAGGMVVPAAIYALLNMGGEATRGWGIPMATDIAFALGVLALVGKGLPSQLRLFLLTLAVADDLGAILVIAVVYTESISWQHVGIAIGLVAVLVAANRLGVRTVGFYVLLGGLFWVAVLKSGVHATMAGVILGLLTPSRAYYTKEAFASEGERLVGEYQEAVASGDHGRADMALGEIEELAVGTESPLERMERLFLPWSAFVVLPVFALANAGVPLSLEAMREAATSMVTLGVAAGLLVGKVLGVLGASWIAVRLGVASLPSGVEWRHVLGAGLLAGIGFTVALFVAGLAMDTEALEDQAKVGILAGSLVAGILGFASLRLAARSQQSKG